MRLRWADYKATRFLLAALAACLLLLALLHAVAECNIRGSIPPDSDSLSYQNAALHTLARLQRGDATYSNILYMNQKEIQIIPPLHKWGLMAGYLLFGVNTFAPYLVSGLWILLAALAVFLILCRLTEDPALSAVAALLFAGMPATLHYGYMETRNDWPCVALVLLAYYEYLESRCFERGWPSFLCGVFLGLALLAKASLLGYAALPLLYLAIRLACQYRSLSRVHLRNLAFCVLAVLGVAGWFYVNHLSGVIEYYTFYAQEQREQILAQYRLDSTEQEYLFYPRNLAVQLGRAPLILVAAGGLALFAVLISGRPFKSLLNRWEAGFLLAWALAPYLILLKQKSYAGPADINMLPFLLIVGTLGAFEILTVVAVRRAAKVLLAGVALLLHAGAFLEHNATVRYQGVDAVSATQDFVSILSRMDYRPVCPRSLFQDLPFNSATLLHVLYKDPVSRNKLDLSIPPEEDLILLSVKTPALARYEKIAQSYSVMLIPDRPKGPEWLVINREWKVLHDAVEKDKRFFLAGRISAYDDGTQVNLFCKSGHYLDLSPDGWLLDGAAIRIWQRPGTYRVTLAGVPADPGVTDLSLIGEDGERLPAEVRLEQSTLRAIFRMQVREGHSGYRVSSKTPIRPAERGRSDDLRPLLIHDPVLDLENIDAEGGAKP